MWPDQEMSQYCRFTTLGTGYCRCVRVVTDLKPLPHRTFRYENYLQYFHLKVKVQLVNTQMDRNYNHHSIYICQVRSTAGHRPSLAIGGLRPCPRANPLRVGSFTHTIKIRLGCMRVQSRRFPSNVLVISRNHGRWLFDVVIEVKTKCTSYQHVAVTWSSKLCKKYCQKTYNIMSLV